MLVLDFTVWLKLCLKLYDKFYKVSFIFYMACFVFSLQKPTSELMAAIQLGIGQSVGGLSSKPERDVLMQDFGVVEVVFFPG